MTRLSRPGWDISKSNLRDVTEKVLSIRLGIGMGICSAISSSGVPDDVVFLSDELSR